MNSMREKQKAEAVNWLKLMGAREDVRKRFEDDSTVMLCIAGRYYPVPDRLNEEIAQFEREQESTVYMVVRSSFGFGLLDALLFVGKYEEEWPLEQEDIKEGYAMSYCLNRDYPECSEMGSIYFRTTEDGGIVREG